jgi:uncharacterized protein (TIGR02284 family)
MLFLIKKTDRLAVLLNDLVKINNDRIACYQNLIEKTTMSDMDLKGLFEDMVNESFNLREQLVEKIKQHLKDYPNKTLVSGMIYDSWTALKIKLIGFDRKNLLSYSEYNEELMQQAYRTAVSISYNTMQKEIHSLLAQQQNTIRKSYELIKRKLVRQPDVFNYFIHA